jgi:hypothetical protein
LLLLFSSWEYLATYVGINLANWFKWLRFWLLFENRSVYSSPGTTTIPAKVFGALLYFLHATSRILPRSGDDHFLPCIYHIHSFICSNHPTFRRCTFLILKVSLNNPGKHQNTFVSIIVLYFSVILCGNNLPLAASPQLVNQLCVLFCFGSLWPSSSEIFTLIFYFSAVFPYIDQCLRLEEILRVIC